jgi:hypothetical protein
VADVCIFSTENVIVQPPTREQLHVDSTPRGTVVVEGFRSRYHQTADFQYELDEIDVERLRDALTQWLDR